MRTDLVRHGGEREIEINGGAVVYLDTPGVHVWHSRGVSQANLPTIRVIALRFFWDR